MIKLGLFASAVALGFVASKSERITNFVGVEIEKLEMKALRKLEDKYYFEDEIHLHEREDG